MRRPTRRHLAASVAGLVGAALIAACGTEEVSVNADDPTHAGAVLFAERCSGCHTMTAAGAQGSANRALRVQGPDLDQRRVSYDDALFAIRNGGFSGAIMPQNIVVGEQARAVARFIDEHSGSEVVEQRSPEPASEGDAARGEAEDARAAAEQEPAGQPEDE